MRQPTPDAAALLEFFRRYLNLNNPRFQIPEVETFSYGPRNPRAGAMAYAPERRIQFNSPMLQRGFEGVARGRKTSDPYSIVAPLHELGHLSGPLTGWGNDARFWEEGLVQAMAEQEALPLMLRMLRGRPRGTGVYPTETRAVYQQAANIGRAMNRGTMPRASLYDQVDTPAGRRYVRDQIPLSNRQRTQYRANQARVARNEEGAPTPRPQPIPSNRAVKTTSARRTALRRAIRRSQRSGYV